MSGNVVIRWSRRRRLAWVLPLLLLAGTAGAGGAWGGLRVAPVRSELTQAAALLAQLRDELTRGDTASAQATVVSLQRHTSAARAVTGGADWRLAAALPGIGDDLGAVAVVAAVLDDLTRDALDPAVRLAVTLAPATLLPKHGRIELAELAASADRIVAVDLAVRAAAQRLAAIDVDGLGTQVRAGVVRLRAAVAQLSALTATAVRVATLAPPMLGAAGTRTYLVLIQNPAEIRATGGMAGEFLVLRAAGGRVSMVEHGATAAGLGTFADPVLALDPAMVALYGTRLGRFPANVNLTPHFPTAAALAAQMYRRRGGVRVDGVLATDPVALSYLLSATGPLSMPTGAALTSANVVRLLLVEAYQRIRSYADKSGYFAAAAQAVFAALSQGRAQPAAAVAALARAAGERRLLLWSAHAGEQRGIEGTVLAGAMPTADGARPTVGVFLNDGSGAKLGYYLTHDAALRLVRCRPDGRRELHLQVTLGSTAPNRGLPDYVLGLRRAGAPYTLRTNVMVFTPAGGAIAAMSLDGVGTPFGAGIERARAVGVVTVDLRPGQRRVVEAMLLTDVRDPAASVAPQLWVTPGVQAWHLNYDSSHFC